MTIEHHKKYHLRFGLALIYSLSSSLLIASYSLPNSALEIPINSAKFTIAKTPDERQPETVEKAIEQIPTSVPPVPKKPKPSIDSPLPARVPPKNRNENPAPSPANNDTTPRRSPSRNENPTPKPVNNDTTPRRSPTRNENPTPQPAENIYTPPRRRNPKPNTNKTSPEGLPFSPSTNLNFREINFVDIAFGILSKNDFKSKGRYFHFYQFEGRENQLLQIRLTGSVDKRSSNNLSLNPFMFVLDPDNNVIAKRGGGGTSSLTKDAFLFVRLSANGKYTIAVTSQNPGDTGRYSLALRNDRASYNIDEAGELTKTSVTLKQNRNPYAVSKFEGKKNQLVSIRVDSIYEDFSPYIVLLDSQGQRIATDNAQDGNYSALIDRARLPKDDTYYVVVLSSRPQERGKYRLTIF